MLSQTTKNLIIIAGIAALVVTIIYVVRKKKQARQWFAGAFTSMRSFWNSLAPEEREQYISGVIPDDYKQFSSLIATAPWQELPPEVRELLRVTIMPATEDWWSLSPTTR